MNRFFLKLFVHLMMKSIHDALVTLDEPTHSYRVSTEPDLTFTSVTTWLAEFFTPFDADAVAADLAAKGTSKKYGKFTKEEILQQWLTIADVGTEVHKQIETYILTGQVPAHDKAFHGYQWLLLNIGQDPNIVLYPEVKLFSAKYQIAGTVDLLIHKKDEDRWIIADWKTNASIPANSFGNKYGTKPATATMADSKLNKYALQMSIYSYILETEYGVSPENRILLHLLEKPTVEFVTGVNPIQTEYLKHTVIEMLADRERQQALGDLFNVDQPVLLIEDL
jgi:ATP-dependent exoDNAse (exonuclease V) beta subunit